MSQKFPGLLYTLVSEWDYHPSVATAILFQFEQAAPCIQEALRQWLTTRQVNAGVCVSGHTLPSLVEAGLTPIAALLRLNELLQEADDALPWREARRQGV